MSKEPKHIFVDVDLHKHRCHVSVRKTKDEVFSGWLPGGLEALRRLSERYDDNRIHELHLLPIKPYQVTVGRPQIRCQNQR